MNSLIDCKTYPTLIPSNLGTKSRGHKECVPGVGESLMVVQREKHGAISIVSDPTAAREAGNGQGTRRVPTVYTRCLSPSMVDISTAGIVLIVGIGVSVKKLGAGRHLAESVPKTYRAALAPSWLSSNRAWKTAPGCVCDIHRRIRHGHAERVSYLALFGSLPCHPLIPQTGLIV